MYFYFYMNEFKSSSQGEGEKKIEVWWSKTTIRSLHEQEQEIKERETEQKY